MESKVSEASPVESRKLVRGQDVSAHGGDEGEGGRLRPPVSQLDKRLAPRPVAYVEVLGGYSVDGAMRHDVEAVAFGVGDHLGGADERVGLEQVEWKLNDTTAMRGFAEGARRCMRRCHDSLDIRGFPEVVEARAAPAAPGGVGRQAVAAKLPLVGSLLQRHEGRLNPAVEFALVLFRRRLWPVCLRPALSENRGQEKLGVVQQHHVRAALQTLSGCRKLMAYEVRVDAMPRLRVKFCNLEQKGRPCM